MLVNELHIAKEIPAFHNLPEITQKKRVRKIIRKVGIEPYIADRATWLIPDTYIDLIKENICPLKSKKEKTRTVQSQKTTGCAAQSREQRYLEARKRLLESKREESQIN